MIHKGLYLGLYYLIYSYEIYSLLWKTLTLQAMQIASYANYNTPYTTVNSTGEVIQKLGNAAKALFYWFSDYQMKANLDKCHF